VVAPVVVPVVVPVVAPVVVPVVVPVVAPVVVPVVVVADVMVVVGPAEQLEIVSTGVGRELSLSSHVQVADAVIPAARLAFTKTCQ
jgi:hypothetical protein